MFRSCGTTIQLSADEITRPGSLRCSFSDQRARSGVGVSLQVTAFRSSVVCGVNHGLSTSRLVCFARLLLRLSLDLYSVVILNQLLLLRTALGSGLWAPLTAETRLLYQISRTFEISIYVTRSGTLLDPRQTGQSSRKSAK